MNLWKQLRERSLFKILFAYLAAGWVGLEVVDQLADNSVLPQAAYQITLIWYLCGIPGALIVGWYHGEKGKQHASRTEVALLVGVVILALTASGGTINDEIQRRVRLNAAAESVLDLRRVAVLYLDDLTPAREAQHIADGLTESLIDELARVRELDVVSRNGVGEYRDTGLSVDSIARALETGTVVTGSLDQAPGDRWRVTLRLVDGQSGAVFSNTSFERPYDDLIAAREELAEQAALLLRNWLGEQVELRQSRRETKSVPAWALYQRGEKARKDGQAALEHADEHAAEEAFEQADQLLSQAELVDPQWAKPSVLRARIAYRRARTAAGHDMHDALPWVRAGLDHVERALAVDTNNPEALEIRGSLKYLHHLLGVEPDPEKDHLLFVEGRNDIERAVALDPRLSSAHATLSHLYSSIDPAASILAGRRAFEEDAYVDNAQAILWRLTNGLYNLEQFVDAKRWCREGQRRFPNHYRFVVCQLQLLTTNVEQPDADRAWRLLARLDSLAPPSSAEWERARGEMFVAGVLVRAGLPDSARSVLLRARERANPELDPERFMLSLEAHIRTMLGDEDEAIDLLKRLAAARPNTDFEGNWWWRGLRGHPRFQELERLTAHH